jgi:hypothetical protein
MFSVIFPGYRYLSYIKNNDTKFVNDKKLLFNWQNNNHNKGLKPWQKKQK